MSRLLFSTLAALAIAAPVAAHHDTPGKSHAVATVTISEPVKADGKPLAPGTYEVWLLNDRANPGAGAASDAQRVVELHQNGKMVAREVAEYFAAGERPVGTSGTPSSRLGKAAVQKLRGGEFVRIAINDASGSITATDGNTLSPDIAIGTSDRRHAGSGASIYSRRPDGACRVFDRR